MTPAVISSGLSGLTSACGASAEIVQPQGRGSSRVSGRHCMTTRRRPRSAHFRSELAFFLIEGDSGEADNDVGLRAARYQQVVNQTLKRPDEALRPPDELRGEGRPRTRGNEPALLHIG